ncbi:PepSY-associated TM helix domain-containing protein [Duganella lactea]|uniref:PepSY-associated TM helix domain-containing protein n=1 Tax=Duganella lactea TaxID=2692173 RepID=UPI001926E557|nr:PepSY-associated TM helix domain-containing protein [Duganella lactea]
MRDNWRPAMGWLHTWAGLITGWLLCAIFMTGTLSVFREPITHWMRATPTLATSAPPVSTEHAASRAFDYLGRHAAAAQRWRVDLPQRPGEALRLFWSDAAGEQQRAMDPASGALLPRPWGRDTDGGRHFMVFHYSLQAGLTGFWIVGVVSMGMLVALVSGVIVHKRIFSDFFTFRPNKGQRSWLDAHNACGVLALPFLFMITLTGLAIFYSSYMPLPLRIAYGADDGAYERFQQALSEEPASPRRERSGVPAAVPHIAPLLRQARDLTGSEMQMLLLEHPGDSSMVLRMLGSEPDGSTSGSIRNQRAAVLFDGASGVPLQVRKPDPHAHQSVGHATHSVVEHLHFARFGGWTMRWLYFLSGLAGTALMATGTILYLVKRRQKSGGEFGAATARVYRCIEALNIASISGCALACIAYFYGNRLLPVALAERGVWEVRIFLLVWLAALAHAALRPRAAAWREQWSLAALLCLGLPLLNFVTTGQHLGRYALRGDWQAAGVELVALSCGALMIVIARKGRTS